MTQPRRGPGGSGPARRIRPGPIGESPRTGSSHRGAGAARSAGLGRPDGDHPFRPAARPASARRPPPTGTAKRTRAPQPHRFTGRATVLGLVLFALLLAYAYPVRIYLNQQAQIAELEASQADQRERIRNLQDETAKWNDPTYVATQARERLQMVKPGDTAYIVSGGGTASAGTDPDVGRATDTGPWYGQLWSSVRAADKPRPAG